MSQLNQWFQSIKSNLQNRNYLLNLPQLRGNKSGKPPLLKRKTVIISLAFIGILVPTLFLTLRSPSRTKADWWNDGYAYRQRFSFTHNADISDDRAVTFSLDTAELITAGVMQSDCDDTRFTDIGGKVLKYELTGSCNNAATTYEVIFPSINNGPNVGYVYYGNPSATAAEIDSSLYTALTPSGGDPAITDRTNEEISLAPFAYWKLDEGYGTTTNNSVSSDFAATLYNSPEWADESQCLSEKCLYFDTQDGADDIRASTTDTTTIPEAYTMSVWVKGELSEQPSENIYPMSWQGIASLRVATTPQNNNIGIITRNAADDAWITTAITTISLLDNQWHQLVATVDTNTLAVKVYADGILIEEDTIASHIANSTSGALHINGHGGTYGNMNGFLDEVKFYDYALSATQVKADYLSKGTVKGVSTAFGAGQDHSFLTDGLVGHWDMDESSWTNDCSTATVFDESGTDSDMIACPDSTGPTGADEGKFSYGGDFEEDSSQELSATHSIDADYVTVAAWIKAESWDSTSNYDGIITSAGTFGLRNNQGNIQFATNTTAWNNGHSGFSASTYIPVDEWHHIVGTYDGTTIKVYVDGQLTDSDVAANPGAINTWGTFRIAEGLSDGRNFDGLIDEVRIYNRALSPREVTTLYNWAPGPVALWNFDEGSGGTVNDISGNGNTGTWNVGTDHWANGKYGKAGYFEYSGTDDLDAGNDSSLDIGSTITVEYWFKPAVTFDVSTPGSHQGLLSRDGWIYNSLRDDSGAMSVSLGNGTSLYLTPSSWDPVWTHIAITYDGTTQRAYINGQLDAQADKTITFTNTNNLYIGEYSTSSGIRFDGAMDDIRIYNYVRTSEQIIQDINAGHPTGGSPISSKLLHLNFDEGYGTDAHDLGYNDDDGTLVDGPSWTNSGKINKGLSLDGLNDRVQSFTSNPFEYTGGDLTLSIWFKPDASDTTTGDIISKPWNGGGEYNYVLGLKADDTVEVRIYNGGTDTNDTIVTSTNSLTTGVWNHLVATFDGDTSLVSIYINGALDNSATHSITDWDPDSGDGNVSFLVGSKYPYSPSWGGNTAFSIQGEIDEVKVYASTLTADQVLLDMNQGASTVLGAYSTASDGTTADNSSARAYCVPGDTSTCNPPVLEWKLDEKTGTDANDTTGNTHTGTITNGSWKSSALCKSGSCLDFNGSSSVITSTNVANLDSGMTVSGWINVDSQASTYSSMVASSASGFVLYFTDDGDGAMDARAQIYNGTSWYQMVCTTNSNFDKWYYLTVVYDDSTTTGTAYLNGSKCSSDIDVSGGMNASYTQAIKSGFYSSYYHDGLIDQLTIYDYPRTPAQVAWDYNRGKPLSHFRLDECSGTDIYDLMGITTGALVIGGTGSNTTAGTCSSGTGTEAWNNGTTGKYNSSMSFDGTDDYIDLTGSDIDDLATSGDFSISAWNKQAAFSGWKAIISQAYSTHIYGRWLVGTYDSNAYAVLHGGDSSPSYKYVVGTKTLATDTWNHIVAIYSRTDGKIYLYVNGVYDNEVAWDGYIQDKESKVNIGVLEKPTLDLYMTGLIDDVQIFNYALNATQVKTLTNEGSSVLFGN